MLLDFVMPNGEHVARPTTTLGSDFMNSHQSTETSL